MVKLALEHLRGRLALALTTVVLFVVVGLDSQGAMLV
jgi:hypothetical protein